MLLKRGRRNFIKGTMGTALATPSLITTKNSQILKWKESERILYPAPGLPGGGQLELRMFQAETHSDPDVLQVARRLKPYNLESWHAEWKQIAEKNQNLAEIFQEEGRKVTANIFYLRAVSFYRKALVYLPENDRRMLSTYHVMREAFDRAWSLVNPPFEQVKIPYQGEMLEGHFYPVRGKVGRSPVIFNYSGADGILIRGTAQRGSQYLKRGIAFFDVDAPGHGGSLRLKKLYAPPDSERVSRVVIDYLVTRSDVDPDRIALHGSSMGGYSGPRCATGDKRIKALAVWSGAFSLREDIFDFYPPIQDRLRWLIGSKDLEQGRREIENFTLEGRAQQIECPMLIGYNKDDRIMDPRGALKLYQEAINSKREMLEGVGHGERKFVLKTYIADWFARQLGTT